MRHPRLAAVVAVAMIVAPAAARRVSPGTAPSSGVPWTPPEDLASPPRKPARNAQLPAELLGSAKNLTLAQLIDISLRNNATTRLAWNAARAREAEMGSLRGALYPQVDYDAKATRLRGTTFGGASVYQSTSVTNSLDVAWLLFDSGQRRSDVEEARQELIAANWEHDASIQDVVLEVQVAYYRYVEAKALLESQRTVADEADANLQAAQDRHDAGVATIADVLEAKTRRAQAELAIVTTRGRITSIRGALAGSVGLPPDTPYDVEPPEEGPTPMIAQRVNELLETAAQKRPDLAAARARVAAADAHVASVQAEGRPSLASSLSLGDSFYPSSGNAPYTYNAGLALRIPLFHGKSHAYDVLQARADADEERTRLDDASSDATTMVWVDYSAVQVAVDRVAAVEALLEQAQQSHEVATGRYRAGVGGILDVLSAQSALDDARAQQASARADWHVALAQLAHDTGSLALATPPSPLSVNPPATSEKSTP